MKPEDHYIQAEELLRLADHLPPSPAVDTLSRRAIGHALLFAGSAAFLAGHDELVTAHTQLLDVLTSNE